MQVVYQAAQNNILLDGEDHGTGGGGLGLPGGACICDVITVQHL